MKSLLAANADPNCVCKVSWYFYFLVASYLTLSVVHVYVCVQDQYTPLYNASARGFNEVVKSLIAANADVNCVCKVSS